MLTLLNKVFVVALIIAFALNILKSSSELSYNRKISIIEVFDVNVLQWPLKEKIKLVSGLLFWLKMKATCKVVASKSFSNVYQINSRGLKITLCLNIP